MAAVKRTCQLPELDEDMGGFWISRKEKDQWSLSVIHSFIQSKTIIEGLLYLGFVLQDYVCE